MMTSQLSALTLDWSPDWAAIFGTPRPLIVEIGFGRGVFLAHLARTHPDHNIIGFEISNRSLEAAERLIVHERLSNVRVVHSTGETALAHLLTPASVQHFHINFPDPWFKTRHRHRRLMRRDIVDAIVSRLAAGGMLYLATDIQEYAEMSSQLLMNTPGLTNTLHAPFVYEMPGRVITKYEATAIREGRACHYFAYQRNARSAPFIPVIEELPMAHLVFSSPLSLDDMFAAFKSAVMGQHSDDNLHIHLMAAYRGTDDAILVETSISEPTINQHIALQILGRWRAGHEGEYTIQVSPLGHPRMTDGVHRAVALLGERVLALHPDAHKLHDKLRG
jgi:tRNA (guanine-N7-)-methyltransferase